MREKSYELRDEDCAPTGKIRVEKIKTRDVSERRHC